MNPDIRSLIDHRFAVLIVTPMCAWQWCSKTIWNSMLTTVHGFLDIITRPSRAPRSVGSKNSTRRVCLLKLHSRPYFIFGHRRFGLTLQVKAPKDWKISDGRICRSVIMRRKRQVSRMRGGNFRNLYFVPPILFVLFSSGFQTHAQQAGSAQAPKLSDKQAFQQIEDRWSQAIAKRDQYALELVLSPELIDISASGNQTTRDQQIAMLFEKNAEPLSLDQRVTNVRRFGELAVVIGSYEEQLRVNRKLVRRTGVFTHIYHNERGNWLCVNAQRTAEAEPALQSLHEADQQSDAVHVTPRAC
jgi:hypothetical protein